MFGPTPPPGTRFYPLGEQGATNTLYWEVLSIGVGAPLEVVRVHTNGVEKYHSKLLDLLPSLRQGVGLGTIIEVAP